MNLKLRFALFFTFFVAVILLASSVTIYFLYKNNRIEDYYQRLKSHCTALVADYKNLRVDIATFDSANYPRRTLFSEQILLIKPSNKIIYSENDTVKLDVTDALIKKIKKEKEIRFREGDFECIGIYYGDLNLYLVGGAIDRTGLRKLSNLFYILVGVFWGGLLITALMSFIVVQQAFKPLARLSQQMQQTTATSMTHKVDEGRNNDEIQQIARNFNAMLDRLNQGFERQKSFIHHASHELRTPLSTMLSQTESALNRDLSIDEYKQILLSLQEEQSELIELTNSLLMLSQFEKLSYPVNYPILRVDELLYDSIAMSKRIYPDIDIKMSFGNTPSDENELILKGNDTLLRSAFRNLIKNAYLYSFDKKVDIVINTDGESIEIDFMNKGELIPQTEIEKMFVPFFRGKNSTLVKGFGLGLSIINNIALIHNGKLSYTAIHPDINKFAIGFKLNPMANESKMVNYSLSALYN